MVLLDRRTVMSGMLGAAAASTLDLTQVQAQGAGTLRIAMTASDIPLPNGQTDQGAEGMRFVEKWADAVCPPCAHGVSSRGRELL